jgi:hypothetical protein
MLASTVQFSTNTKPTPSRASLQPHRAAVLTQTWIPSEPTTRHRADCLRAQQGACTTTANRIPTRSTPAHAGSTRSHRDRCPQQSSPVSPPLSTPPPHSGSAGSLHAFARKVLLRKEVIQPHLPVRLPCYDFVPIASPTFDGSLHKGWATGFGCCRLS